MTGMRVLRGVVYILKRIGPRTKPWVRHRKGDKEVKQNQKQEQRKSEMLSKF